MAIKFLAIPSQNIWGDEAFSIFYSQQNLSDLTDRLTVDTNAPLYFYLLHFWIKLFGISELAVKSMSVVFSTFAALFIYRIAHKIQGMGMAITVSLFFLFSNLHFDFSHQVRGYSLICLEVSASFFFLIRYIQQWRIRDLIWVCAINVLIAYTHYIAILAPVVQFIIVWLFKPDKINVKRIFLGYLSSLLLFSPYVIVLLNNVPDENFWLQKPGWIEFKYVIFKLVGNDNFFWFLFIPFTLAPFFLFSPIRQAVFKPALDSRLVLLFTCWYFVPIFSDFLVSFWKPVFLMRYLLFGSIGFYLGLTYLIWNLKLSEGFRIGISAIYVVLFISHFSTDNRSGEDWKGTANILNITAEDSTANLVCAGYKIRDLAYYYDRESFANDYKDIYESMRKKHVFAISGDKDVSEILENNAYKKINLILSHNELSDPNHTIEKYFANHQYRLCDEYSIGYSNRLLVYRTGSKACYSLIELTTREVEHNCYTWELTHYSNELNNSTTTEYKLKVRSPRICDSKGAAFKKSDNGMLGFHINKKEEYSPGLKLNMPDDVAKVTYSFSVAGNKSTPALLVFLVESDNNIEHLQTHNLNGLLNVDSVHQFSYASILPTNLSDDSMVKVYLWNPGEEEVILTNLSVRFWQSIE